uniref:Single-stranded-DNA-specific exonuclease RecJ n=1 Tax=candidate division WOR-3 bacterium TaxID=2052148 RepID=A0A7C4GG91_UNCW3
MIFPWQVKPVDEALVSALVSAAGLPVYVARLLALRGVSSATQARQWLKPELDHLHPARLLPDFQAAAGRVLGAIGRREPILVWGHDDLDGMTATAVLCRLLDNLRADVRYHIPSRVRDRHGLDPSGVERELPDGGLVLTVDCGITNIRAVAAVRQRGVDVVITDHHEVLDELPPAVASVDPKRPDSEYPYRGLAGVGVALKFGFGIAEEAIGIRPREFVSTLPDLMALAVLGTLADRVPLTGENRTLVSVGMRFLEETRLPAVRAVLDSVGGEGRLTAAKFVAELLPLFASADGREGVARLLSDDADAARRWVDDLRVRSREWREEAERTFTLAQELVQVGDGILFARSREFSLRALGSTAARLKERYQLPAVVMGWRGDAWVGECRGMDGVNLIELFKALRRYLDDYGGHRKAAGFSLQDNVVEEFVRQAELYAHENFAGNVVPERGLQADAVLPIEQFSADLVQLAPFGEGNPEPVFVSEPVRLSRSEAGWVVSSRPELALVSGRRELSVQAGQVAVLLYSMDDFGRLTLLDAKPVSG